MIFTFKKAGKATHTYYEIPCVHVCCSCSEVLRNDSFHKNWNYEMATWGCYQMGHWEPEIRFNNAFQSYLVTVKKRVREKTPQEQVPLSFSLPNIALFLVTPLALLLLTSLTNKLPAHTFLCSPVHAYQYKPLIKHIYSLGDGGRAQTQIYIKKKSPYLLTWWQFWLATGEQVTA